MNCSPCVLPQSAVQALEKPLGSSLGEKAANSVEWKETLAERLRLRCGRLTPGVTYHTDVVSVVGVSEYE